MKLKNSTRRLLLSMLAAASVSGLAGPAGASDTLPADVSRITRAPLASALVELAYSEQQGAVFVSAPDWQDETRSTVLRLAPDTLAVQATIPMQVKSFGVALDDVSHRLYLTQGFNGSVGVVDTASNQVLSRIPVMEKVNMPQFFRDAGISGERLDGLLKMLERFKIVENYPYKLRELVYDKRNQRLFAPGLGLGTDSVLFVIDARRNVLEKVLPGFGYNAVGIALDEKNGRVFVSNMQGQLMTVDARTLKTTHVHEVQVDQLLNLVYDEAGNRLFGVDQGIDRDRPRNSHLGIEYARRSPGHRVFALDADTGKVLADMPTSEVPIGLRFDPQRQRLYVANRAGVRIAKGKGSVTIYDTAAYRLLQTIDLPPHPNSVTLDSAGKTLFVTVKNDGDNAKAKTQEYVARVPLAH